MGCAPDDYDCLTWLNTRIEYPYIDQPVVFQELGAWWLLASCPTEIVNFLLHRLCACVPT
jgi:hypothetical protein